MSAAPPSVRKVAVLGGGLGGLTAAFELTATAELRASHEVTVYTDGWLLGGKAASVRNPAEGNRIEQQGRPLIAGSSELTFRLLRRCFEELERGSEEPIGSLDQAFVGRDRITLWEHHAGRWSPWTLRLPGNSRPPGKTPGLASEEQLHTALVASLRDGATKAVALAQSARKGAAPHPPEPPAGVGDLLQRLGERALTRVGRGDLVGRFTPRPREPTPPPSRPPPTELFALIDHALFELRPLSEADDRARRLAVLLDVGAAIVRGMRADHVLTRGFGSLDEEDLVAWLRRHGSKEAMSAPVLALYGSLFGFPDGNWRKPSLAAGVGLGAALRLIFDSRGASLYAAKAGLGECLFVPLYEVLRRRGVRFRFFQRVCGLKASTDGTRIDRIRVGQQVRLKGLEYEPLITCGPLRAWSAEPDYAQITAPVDLRKHRPRAHERWPYPHFIGETVLQRGVDFHDVVLAIPAPALGEITNDLVRARPEAWGRMVQSLRGTPTFGVDCRFQRPLAGVLPPGAAPVGANCPAPVDVVADLSISLSLAPARESEGTPPSGGFVHLSGARPVNNGEASQEEIVSRMREICRAWLASNGGALWPGAAAPENPAGLDWDALSDAKNRAGSARFDAAHVVASLEPSDGYVASPPGSTRDRLGPDQSGFENLYLAGDWVKTALSSGTLESAVMSGTEAAGALVSRGHTATPSVKATS